MTIHQSEREIITRAADYLTKHGFLSATGGNISVRVAGQPLMAITPSNYDYQKMAPQDICILNLEAEVQDARLKPSVESGMHAAIYKTRPDVQAIIHTHQVYPSTLAIINKPIPALFDEQVRFLGRSIDIIPYAPSGTGMLKNKVAKFVGNHHNAYMMANHGALVFGDSMERAIHNVEVLEKCSLAYLLAICSGEKISNIPMLVREIAFGKLRSAQKEAEKTNTL
jgi:ribulose-5-phosphate 4-epimerase/fuculose-1-phosphate aldolase